MVGRERKGERVGGCRERVCVCALQRNLRKTHILHSPPIDPITSTCACRSLEQEEQSGSFATLGYDADDKERRRRKRRRRRRDDRDDGNGVNQIDYDRMEFLDNNGYGDSNIFNSNGGGVDDRDDGNGVNQIVVLDGGVVDDGSEVLE